MVNIVERMRRFITNEAGVRTRHLFRLNIEPFVRIDEIKIRGRKNLTKLPAGRSIIFAVTHLDDISVQILGYWLLKNGYDVFFTQQSAQKSFRESPHMAMTMVVLGWNRFFSIQSRTVKGMVQGRINYGDYRTIAQAAPQYLVIAAHNPIKPFQKHELPPKAGKAVPLTAIVIKGIVLPVAIHFEGSGPTMEKLATGFRKPVMISFGKPIDCFADQDISAVKARNIVQRLLISGNQEQRLDQETMGYLKKIGNQIMSTLASLLPEEEKGNWESGQQMI